MSIRNEAPAVVVSTDATKWYWALSTARSVHAEVMEHTSPAGEIMTKAANEFWRTARQKAGDRKAWQADIDAHAERTFFLMVRGNDPVGGFCIVAGELQGMWVDVRRQGQGTWLLRQAVQRGARTLNCFEDVAPFYAKDGWVEVGRTPNWTEGKPDVVFMELPACK